MTIKYIAIIHMLFFHCYLGKCGMQRLKNGIKLNGPVKELCYIINFNLKTFTANPNEAIKCYNYY